MPKFPVRNHPCHWRDPETESEYFFNGYIWFSNGKPVEQQPDYIVNGSPWSARRCTCGLKYDLHGGRHSRWCDLYEG